ncbi:NADPH-dependent oxidoreductase [Ligilactobacillus salivarius]|uniref:NADPH-dependent oxidoreductase n=1 Tax=Ligilactobacillus salivarius TaxID=1624 RepID=UPI001879A6A1|nr:NADPH-dependent oxidoreductase [Ligilactobacillus salivarius]MBE7387280.1 NADPH-dependent oxidoreductase [Ligilactobacillus salivarius]MBE7391674.1 NADPH-dependent oxidoreductase [Ligilactobacillus salivarius]
MIENETIKHQLNHRAIRAFKDQTLSEEQLTTLYEVARHTATSMFMQQFSILHITDEEKRKQIRKQMGNDDGRLHTMDIFFQAFQDTMLAVQNVINAAESMGLGIVPLGTVNDDPKAMLKVLDLPELTYPALGLQVGVPDQEPQLKPRLPLEFTTFENEYPRDFEVSELKDYDEIVQTYYDLRDANRRIDSFTNQINGKKLNTHQNKRDDIVEAIHSQGLALDFN